jgi:NAD(P)-dependent dehydrogenase (short-subunit alcohol dehydrogenase family)
MSNTLRWYEALVSAGAHNALTRQIAVDYARKRIRGNAVVLSIVMSPMVIEHMAGDLLGALDGLLLGQDPVQR